MARVTVEDCVLKVPNRFELVMVSSQRAREINAGSPINVERDNDKNTVVALREIADGLVCPATLKESLIKNHQKVIEVEDEGEEVIDVMEGEEDWAGISEQASEEEAALAGLHEDDLSADAEDFGMEDSSDE